MLSEATPLGYGIHGLLQTFLFQPKYHEYFLRKYCMLNHVDGAMIYLPFLLILLPLPLTGAGRIMSKYCIDSIFSIA